MVRMNHLDDKVADLKQHFFGLIQHSYLQEYINEPKVDEDKLRFLYTMLSDILPKKESKVFTLSALLVNAALDVHESVTLHKIQSDSIKKNRQLTVLAGDYYVSLYYYLLADSNHLPMIKVFSHSIQEINEHKMNVYQGEEMTYKETKENVQRIESVLFQNIADYYELSTWKEVFSSFFFLKRLVVEKEEWLSGKAVPLIRGLVKDYAGLPSAEKRRLKPQEVDRVLAAWEEEVDTVKEALLIQVKRMPKFEGFILDHLNNLLGSRFMQEKVAEEG